MIIVSSWRVGHDQAPQRQVRDFAQLAGWPPPGDALDFLPPCPPRAEQSAKDTRSLIDPGFGDVQFSGATPFSPDGALIAYVRREALWVAEVESGAEHRRRSGYGRRRQHGHTRHHACPALSTPPRSPESLVRSVCHHRLGYVPASSHRGGPVHQAAHVRTVSTYG